EGAKAAYLMIPPDIRNQDYRAYQDRLVESIGTAVEKAGLSHALVLSSVGADKPDKTGPVVGLHNLEQRLNRISGLNMLALRPAYFMENTLPQTVLIRMFGMTAGALRGDLSLPMISTRDIGEYAVSALLKSDFRGKQTRELLGERDLTMNEVSTIIGKAIGKPDLKYNQLPDEQTRGGLISMGMSPSIANLILEMAAAMNSGYMCALEQRSAENTTSTSYEKFVDEEFVPSYQKAAAA
ncbi:MAG TPA: NmrA family NAD(P)-binding protein, partial [Terriglobales bacterium]|nr:NmrA family NAD(P)-binding protein [Terriglobales bacterium]